ncbi:hypothetical protein ACPPVV_00660 [Rhodanobacter sp. Col0626]|uniref:hypothetical protein n=1 Tax=Rhodanobacter sp. Col0626 TaxID=3415679 RepID=UPI003CF4F3EF
MKRWHGWLVLALVPAFARAPPAQAGAIYKCMVKGAAVYQDQPCSTGNPEAGRLSGPSSQRGDPVAGNDPGALIRGIGDLTERDGQLQAQHDRELDQLRARMAGVRDEQVQRREVGQFNRGWQERFAENSRRREALVNRLRELCPGGASGNSRGHTCHPRDSSGASR